MQTKTAKVVLKNEAGKEIASREFTAVRFEVEDDTLKGKTDQEAATLIGTAFNDAVSFLRQEDEKANPVNRILTYLSRAYDLERRAAVRQALVAQVEGPGVAIDKAATAMVKAMAAVGITLTLDQARATIKAQMDAAKAA